MPNSLWPILTRSAPSASLTTLALSAPKNSRSPLRAPVRAMISAIAASLQVLDDRRLQALAALGDVVDLDPGQALGAVDLDELGVAVDLAAAHLAAARARAAPTTRPPCGRRAAPENTLKSTVAHHVGELGELQLDAQVGLVGAEAAHRLRVRSSPGKPAARR